MKLFISYARVDQPYCNQIVEMLSVHDVWYDQRLHAGQDWWDVILKQLDWCEGFVYLLSPDSVKSEYCQREFSIAAASGKSIFPVLIQKRTEIPKTLKHLQYADLSNGLDVTAVKELLDSIYIAEKGGHTQRPMIVPEAPVSIDAPNVDPATLMDEVARAWDSDDFDRTVFLLKQARDNGYTSRFIDLDTMLSEAETALERQAYLKEAEREYKQIVAFITRKSTRTYGCQAFQAFRQDFPGYDPQNIAAICASEFMPMLEWCDIPEGNVTIERNEEKRSVYLPPFQISKYPVTFKQYQLFIDDPQGYANPCWWAHSEYAVQWQQNNPLSINAKFPIENHPRENINWYEAMAFCKWLSKRTGLSVTLPSEAQWVRAAQGDERRPFPWGNRFDRNRANTRETRIRSTSPVTSYTKGVSPFGVHDMAGNVWEWCNTESPTDDKEGDCQKMVKGGSFISPATRSQTDFHFFLNPQSRYATIGFRVVCLLD